MPPFAVGVADDPPGVPAVGVASNVAVGGVAVSGAPVGLGLSVAVWLGVGLMGSAVRVGDGAVVAVGVGKVPVGVTLGVSVREGLGVGLGVGVTLGVGVALGVRVFVGVGVIDGVRVGVGVGRVPVAVAVGVRVTVGLGVVVGVILSASFSSQTWSAWLKLPIQRSDRPSRSRSAARRAVVLAEAKACP